MTPEFDEEVVFENSPLYQYLQDLGHTDFEICSSLSPKTEKCTTEGQQKPPTRVLPKYLGYSNHSMNINCTYWHAQGMGY
ncbi:VEZT isoform 38 [Pan troglodytes]|uniref:VEZT isoform 18 n=3 Tax=Hominidae TaxID=9604 RepID=A0A2J8XMZ7_PONAB|nr:vezatin, adherens junctions transmembrane protein [Homo sapiens]PNI65363.1 VEZT isoform 2 [Pan troglodytes]PNJ83399.1 VEZT isoform 2 [Pongo abelii]KAI2567389.1 vezatin, adherens junctions transmembrane protein [Homo sapiens]KAI2567390.1 vezatin, adherens junctions transmembrane protein [Homo sapiens]